MATTTTADQVKFVHDFRADSSPRIRRLLVRHQAFLSWYQGVFSGVYDQEMGRWSKLSNGALVVPPVNEEYGKPRSEEWHIPPNEIELHDDVEQDTMKSVL